MAANFEPVRVGVLGCGNISRQYFTNAGKFPILDLAAVADLDRAAAERAAAEHGVGWVLSPDELVAGDACEVVLNLTVPQAHVPTMLRTLDAGKPTFCEKPLGVDRDEGRRVLDAARAKNLPVGVAPDTVLGSGIQTARKAIDDGLIGDVTAFTATMAGGGHEGWHPSPEFYYKPGGGPMFDMGPYYLTALMHLLGPIRRVAGLASVAVGERTITSQPKFGQKIAVETPDHYVGVAEFARGTATVTGTIVQSFAMPVTDFENSHPITLHGTAGMLRVPDPNGFDGIVRLKRRGEETWEELPPATPTGYGRAVGLADLCHALREAAGRTPRCHVAVGYAALDAMQAFRDSGTLGGFIDLSTDFDRPAPMPAEFGTFA